MMQISTILVSAIQTFTHSDHKTEVFNSYSQLFLRKLFSRVHSMWLKWPPFSRTHVRSRTRHCRTAR